jgi:hypothetical protein
MAYYGDTYLSKMKKQIEEEQKVKAESKVPYAKVQYENPNFTSESETRKTSYQWEKDFLSDLPQKQYGKSYNDKFKTWATEIGIPEVEHKSFRKYLDSREEDMDVKGTKTRRYFDNELPKRREQAMEARRAGDVHRKQQQAQQEVLKQEKTEAKDDRGDFFNFLDRTLGKASRGANSWLFGEEFVEKNAKMQKELAEDDLENATSDEEIARAKERLAMNYTVNREAEGALEKGSEIAGGVVGSLAPYAKGYQILDKGIKGTKLLGQLNKVENPIVREFLRGSIASGGVATGVAVTRDVSGEDMSAGDYAKFIGAEAAIGGVADAGIGAVWRKVGQRFKAGETPEQIAQAENIPVEEVLDVFEQSKPFLEGTLEGQSIVDPRVPQLNAPEPEIPLQLDGQVENPIDEVLGLGNPDKNLYRSHPRGTSPEVQVEGTPQLEAPARDLENLDELVGFREKASSQRQQAEEAFVKEKMKPIDDVLEQVSQGEAQWEQIKQSKDVLKRIKDAYGELVVPESNWADWGKEVPSGLRAKKGTKKGVDLYTFAEQEGYSSVDEAVEFLKSLHNDTKLRKKDIVPKTKKFNEKEYDASVESFRQEFKGTDNAKQLDSLLDNLTNRQKEAEIARARQAEAEALQQGDPLAFKQSKNFRADFDPVSYVGRMNPKDQSAVRSETGYSTRYKDSPSGDTLEINPDEPLEFKRTVPQEGMKRQMEKEVSRGVRAEVDSRKPSSSVDDTLDTLTKNEEDLGNTNTRNEDPLGVDEDLRAPVEPSGNAKPVGITPKAGEADGPIAHTETGIKGFFQKIKEGKKSLPKDKQEFKQQYISDAQYAKDIEREFMKLDKDKILSRLPDGTVSVKDSLFKATRMIRLSASQAAKSIEKDYVPILRSLDKAKIKPKEFDNYSLAVHAKDILENNLDKVKRAGQVHNELESIQKQIQTTNDKNLLKELNEKEGLLVKELEGLDPYILPETATEEWVNRTLAQWRNNDTMKNAHKAFMRQQRKDLSMRVNAGELSQAEASQWMNAHPNYISMRRKVDDATGIRLGRGRQSGSSLQIESPLESAVLNRAATIRRINENTAKQKIVKFSQVDGQNWFHELDPKTATENQLERSVRFKVDGEEKLYEVPPTLKDLWDKTGETEAKDITNRVLRGFNNVIKKGATHYNTDFILKSMLREPQQAIMTSRTNMHPGDLVLGFMDSFLGDNLTKLTGAKSYRQAFKDGGGDITGYISMDYESAAKTLEDVSKGSFGKGWNIVNPLKVIERVGAGVENANKLAEFRSAKKKGYSDDDAMFEAVDIFDFSDAGSSTRKWNQKVPYLNAAIRGNTRILQAAKEHPVQFTTKGLGYITLPTLGAYAMRFHPDVSDEQRTKLRNMPEYRKNMFWHIPVPNSEEIVAIPKAHLVAQIFANPAERALDQMFDTTGKDWGDAGLDTVKDTLKTLIPPTSMALVSQISGAVANHDWFTGMPVEDTAMGYEAPVDRYNMYTSELAKGIAKQTDKLPLPDSMQSPARIDYVLKGLTGGTGRDTLDVVDNLLASDGERPAKINSIDEVLNPAKQFKYDSTGASGVYDRLYKKKTEDERADKKGTRAIREYEKMQEINKEIKALREDTKLTSKEKRAKVERLRDQQRKIGDYVLKSGILEE